MLQNLHFSYYMGLFIFAEVSGSEKDTQTNWCQLIGEVFVVTQKFDY